jgi:hypothetical protein
MGLIMWTKEQKDAWRKANAEKCRAYQAVYRAKKKGVEPPPEVLAKIAQWEAEKEAAKASRPTKAQRAKARYQSDPEHREKLIAKRRADYNRRYKNDPEFRAKQLEKRRLHYKAQTQEKSEAEKEAVLRKRRENMAKAHRVRVAKQRAEAPKRVAEREQKKQIVKAVQASQQMKRKPGRLLALMGWRGF